jgi:nucleoside-diphosphate-sugar epimerase
MIIGNGMIARRFEAFEKNDDVLIFASGVSNSKETRPGPFEREVQLVESALTSESDKLFVYFSTCSIEDPTESGSEYIRHKLHIEEQIAATAKRYLIFRTSNVVGGNSNPHTVLNFFFRKIKNGESFDVWKGASRNLIDLDDVFRIVTHCLDTAVTNRIVNVANPENIAPLMIVEVIESFLGTKGNYRILDKGCPFHIDCSEIALLFIENNVNCEPAIYTLNLLEKYYR